MTFTASQRQRAIGLYKRLLRTSRKTFDGDAVAIVAARDETRRRFKIAAKETDAAKIDEGLKMGDEIVSVLRQNVVQGKWRQEREAYGKFTPHCLEPSTFGSVQSAHFALNLFSDCRTSHDQGH